MQLAVLCPRDNIVGLLSEDQQAVTTLTPSTLSGRAVPTGDFRARFADSSVIQVDSKEDAFDRLSEFQDRSLALDFTLLLFDEQVKGKTKADIAAELDEMLADKSCHDYVVDILFASPLPEAADAIGALEAASGKLSCASLIQLILDCQNRVRFAYDAWLSLRVNPMVTPAVIDDIRGAMVSQGVFRRLVERGKTQVEVDSIRGRIILEANENKKCDARILTSFISGYSAKLPVGRRMPNVEVVAEELSHNEPNAEVTGRSGLSKPRERADVKLERAEKQIEAITDQFANGNDQLANRYLNELVDSQSNDVGDHRYLVKSLCNVANRCTIAGRREVSLECLKRALQFTAGIDTILYLQIGNEFRELNQFQRALDCYQEAKQLDSGEKRDSIRHEIIRVSVAKGDYETALQQYNEFDDLDRDPQLLSGLGTLHRKMGDLRGARLCYWQALSRRQSYHPAMAGLAEVRKQSGKHHRALASYNTILRDFPAEIEDMSRKIYELARSFLFRVTRQYKSSKLILEELLAKYPMDQDVHFQLAKVLTLTGDAERAREHFQNAQGTSLSKIASELYALAVGERIDTRGVPGQDAFTALYLPEHQGLANCKHAITAIAQGEYDQAEHLMRTARFVDKLHADFGAVLGFHAAKRINPGFNYKSRQTLARIGKRGYPELRESVHSIANDDFDTAEDRERRMCLLVA